MADTWMTGVFFEEDLYGGEPSAGYNPPLESEDSHEAVGVKQVVVTEESAVVAVVDARWGRSSRLADVFVGVAEVFQTQEAVEFWRAGQISITQSM